MTEEEGLASELTRIRVSVAKRKGWHQDSIEILKQTEDPEEAYRLGASHEARLRRASTTQTDHSTPVSGRLALVLAVVVGGVLLGIVANANSYMKGTGAVMVDDAHMDDPRYLNLGSGSQTVEADAHMDDPSYLNLGSGSQTVEADAHMDDPNWSELGT